MNTDSKTAFPLCWPDAWPRAKSRTWSAFAHRGRNHSMEEARRFLADELDRLGARDAILSTNMKLRVDGQPYSGLAQPNDPGVAVYFKLKGRDTVLACDKWQRVECNLWAIAKHVESIRGQARWGVGNIEQAFRGYTALPERAAGAAWWEVLGVPINASEEQITAAFREKALAAHPDLGGSHEAMVRVNEAYEQATQQRSAA